MSLTADLLLVAEADCKKIDQALVSVEEQIKDAGSSVDAWTVDQAIRLREALDSLRARLDDFNSDMGQAEAVKEIGRIRSEMLHIDDLRRAVATFQKYVANWVRAF